mmetsp:Transcript_8026/g.10461  ORF Transcript_8026/g.10461 Transcript_8026/m.10461 type:complete len:268 (-) Transcript_8026:28-831(-)
MVCSERLRWLTEEIAAGRNAFVSFSFNDTAKKEKIKFTLQSGYIQHGTFRPALLGALASLQVAVDQGIATDKGHFSHSTSASVVEFWLKQPGVSSDPAGQTETHSPGLSEPLDIAAMTGANDHGLPALEPVVSPTWEVIPDVLQLFVHGAHGILACEVSPTMVRLGVSSRSALVASFSAQDIFDDAHAGGRGSFQYWQRIWRRGRVSVNFPSLLAQDRMRWVFDQAIPLAGLMFPVLPSPDVCTSCGNEGFYCDDCGGCLGCLECTC